MMGIVYPDRMGLSFPVKPSGYRVVTGRTPGRGKCWCGNRWDQSFNHRDRPPPAINPQSLASFDAMLHTRQAGDRWQAEFPCDDGTM